MDSSFRLLNTPYIVVEFQKSTEKEKKVQALDAQDFRFPMNKKKAVKIIFTT